MITSLVPWRSPFLYSQHYARKMLCSEAGMLFLLLLSWCNNVCKEWAHTVKHKVGLVNACCVYLRSRGNICSPSNHLHQIGSFNHCCNWHRGFLSGVVVTAYSVTRFMQIRGIFLFLLLLYCPCCVQIIGYILAWKSYSYVCTLHSLSLQWNLGHPDPDHPEISLSGRVMAGMDFLHSICTRIYPYPCFRIWTAIWGNKWSIPLQTWISRNSGISLSKFRNSQNDCILNACLLIQPNL